MRLVSEAQVLYSVIEEFDGIPLASWENYLKSSIRKGLPLIGMPAQYYLQSALAIIDDDGTFPYPESASELHGLLLIDEQGNATQPALLRPGNMAASADALIKIPYAASSYGDVPAVRFDPAAGVFFIENMAKARAYEKAVISYTGFSVNDEGDLMLPEAAAFAIEAFLAYRIKTRLRNRDGSRISEGEVQSAFDTWKALAGDAKGKLRATPRARMQEVILEEYYRGKFVTPYRRTGQ